MDAAYNAHSGQSRRKNRSSTNLNHLSLAPLTMKLPINDSDMIFSDLSIQTTSYSTSYIGGKSAPTTPSLLSRSPGRATPKSKSSHAHSYKSATPLLKSKSTTQLSRSRSGAQTPRSGTTTPGGHRRRSRKDAPEEEEPQHTRRDGDWLLRTGAMISSDTRESKGQSWLVSRASSTSLGRLRDGHADGDEDGDHDIDMFERDRIARENVMASRHASRRGSGAFAGMEEDFSPLASRRGSVFASRTGSRSQLVTPGERAAVESYFAQQGADAEYAAGPDFVNLDERLEATGEEDMDTFQDDEALVRGLVKGGQGARPGSWFGNILGTLFAVEENEEEDDLSDGEGEDDSLSNVSAKHFEGVTALSEQRIPAPKIDEGGWQDAAWLLSIASKVAWS